MSKTWRRARNDWDEDGYDEHRDYKKKKKKKRNNQKLEIRKQKEQFLENEDLSRRG